jgi:hypothetical protein
VFHDAGGSFHSGTPLNGKMTDVLLEALKSAAISRDREIILFCS